MDKNIIKGKGKYNYRYYNKLSDSPRMIMLFVIGIALSIYTLCDIDLDRFSHNVLINFGLDIGAMFVGLVILICYTIDGIHSGEDVKLFKFIIAVDFAELVADIFAWVLEGNPDYKYAVLIINSSFYLLGYCLVYLFWRYILDFLKEKSALLSVLNKILNVGMVFAVAVIGLNLKYEFIFKVTANGIYERMAFHPISHIYAYVVMVATLVAIIENRKKFFKQQFVTFLAYILVPGIVSLISLFVYGYSFLYPAIMIIILLMFSMINVARSRMVAIVNNELKTAAKIQADALPKNFEEISKRGEFEIYARMQPAYNIGGDFYDFFMIDDDHLAIVMADVSGKGMSAALFMMESRILIKNTALVDVISPSKILEQVNKQLCEGNKQMYFVTVWLGILTISTGQVIYANAGHGNPMIYRKGAGFNPRREKHGPPLAIEDNIVYSDEVLTLNKGDIICVYTDGVSEARDVNGSMFGDKRVNEVLNKEPGGSLVKIIDNMHDALQGFTNATPQFDDMTMLLMRYNGSKSIDSYQDDKITSLKVEAIQANLPMVIEFLNGIMEREGASKSVINKVDVAVDELFVNIARYAYDDKVGLVVIKTKIELNPRAIVISFIDEGKKYNPLKKKDPDVSLTSDLRDIGGLGIYIVKKTMDFVYYEHKGGNNIFTIKKYFDEEQ